MLLCLKYSKGDEARFLSHLDLMRTMERAFRRACLPLAFSEGFNPHPRVSFASALAVGVTSEGEYLDLQLREDLSSQEVIERVNKVLPSGLNILAAVPVTQRKESLMALINRARYRVKVDFGEPVAGKAVEQVERVEQMIATVTALSSYLILRQGKKRVREVDIRPGLFELVGKVAGGKLILEMEVQTGSEGNIRPEEILVMVRETSPWPLGENLRIHRLGLYIYKNGQNWSPLETS